MSVNDNPPLEPQIENKPAIFSKLRSYFILLMVTLMGLGNWVDTKSLLVEGYHGFVTHFTNKLEEKKIANLDIGNYLPYTQRLIGDPQIIKTSQLNPEYEYRYYKDTKYLLTIINKNTRIVGIVVHSLSHDKATVADFAPNVPFSKLKLRENNIKNIIETSNLFSFDSNNIQYYMQVKQLSAQGMFLNLASGFSNYTDSLNKETLDNLFNLDEATLLSDDKKTLTPLTNRLANNKATFYALSELSSEYIADTLLTKYEFDIYF